MCSMNNGLDFDLCFGDLFRSGMTFAIDLALDVNNQTVGFLYFQRPSIAAQ